MKSTSSAVEIAGAVNSTQTSAHSVIVETLGRIEANNGRVNAFTETLSERALAAAIVVDAQVKTAGLLFRIEMPAACIERTVLAIPPDAIPLSMRSQGLIDIVRTTLRVGYLFRPELLIIGCKIKMIQTVPGGIERHNSMKFVRMRL